MFHLEQDQVILQGIHPNDQVVAVRFDIEGDLRTLVDPAAHLEKFHGHTCAGSLEGVRFACGGIAITAAVKQ